MAFTSASRPRSQPTARPPMADATASAPATLRSTTTTPAASSAAKRSHNAFPMPDAPPVTTQTLAVTRISTGLGVGGQLGPGHLPPVDDELGPRAVGAGVGGQEG